MINESAAKTENNHQIWASDINSDFYTDVLDVVTIVNIVINGGLETRDTFQIISEEIFVPYCSGCHYDGSFYAEQSGLVMTEDVLYGEMKGFIDSNPQWNQDSLMSSSLANFLFQNGCEDAEVKEKFLKDLF